MDVADSDELSEQPRLWVLPESLADFSLEDLRQVASAGSSFRVTGRAAFVAPSAYVFGLARQATMVRDDNLDRFDVFRTEAEALAWLDVEKG